MKTIAEIRQFFTLESSQEGGGEFLNTIPNLTIDSRQLQKNDCFIALQGEQVHGLDFLPRVLAKKPSLILSDKALSAEQQTLLALHGATESLVIEQLSTRLGALASWFYQQPSQRFKVVGITGTNGKTSTAFYVAQLLEALGQEAALIGTLGNGVWCNGAENTLSETRNTTPDVVSVHRLLAEFAAQGVDWVIMEVSSHALELGRVSGVEFDTVALTQVTRDHIDFHGSLNAYHQAKKKLFTDYPTRVSVLNAKDAVGQSLIAQHTKNASQADCWIYSVEDIQQEPERHLSASQIKLSAHGIAFTLSGLAIRGGQGELSLLKRGCPGVEKNKRVFVPLLGAFNVENVLCALSIVLAGVLEKNRSKAWSVLVEKLSSLQAVPGRMQPIELPEPSPTVLVDFAHTPDALQQVLMAIKQHVSESTAGRLWVVFGCGGDRDQGKRPLMAEVVERVADKVVVTSDNPRSESPEQIVAQVMAGFQQPNRVHVVLDRAQAIEWTLSNAASEDVVLIAGKGHETYQEIQGIKTPFQDKQVVLNWVLGVKK